MSLDPDQQLAELYDRLATQLYSYALAMLRDGGLAQDVVQDAFVSLARWPGWARHVRSPERYLRRSVRNGCISIMRSARAQQSSASPGHNDRSHATHDLRLALEDALAQLPVEQREVVLMKVVQGMTFHEIARAVGASANTVASRYRYALGKLRHYL